MFPSFYTFVPEFAPCLSYLSQTRPLPNCQVAAAPESLQRHRVHWPFFSSDCKILQSCLCCLFHSIGSFLTMVIVLLHYNPEVFSQRNTYIYWKQCVFLWTVHMGCKDLLGILLYIQLFCASLVFSVLLTWSSLICSTCFVASM